MQVIHKPKPDPKLMTQTELLAYVHELEAENARLEESFQKATGVIAMYPSVNAEPVKHGCWILTGVENVYGGKQIKCSECGFTVIVSPEHYTNLAEYETYCCHCGAKMDGGADND